MLDALTACQSEQDVSCVECALWAIENLFLELPTRMIYKHLSKQVYPIVK